MCRFLFLSALLLLVNLSFAQKDIVYSEPFPEPEGGWKKLMLLSNGSTAYLNITFDYIEVRLYDKERKRTGMQKINHTQWTDRKMSATNYTGVHEINGQIVLFMDQQMRKNTPVLKKLIIDPVTGRLVSSNVVYSLGEDREREPFNVIKNDATDRYAVMFPEGNNHTSYKVVLYDNNHKLVQEAVLSPTGFDRINIKKVVFRGDDLHIFFNNTPPKTKQSKQPLHLAILKNGGSEFEVYKLDADVFDVVKKSNFAYNDVTGLYEAIFLAEIDHETKSKMLGNVTERTVYYGMELLFLDPNKHTVIGQYEIGGKDLDEHAKQKMFIKDGYNGLFDKLLIHEDGTTDMLFEEASYITNRYGTTTQAGALGILQLNIKGELGNKYIIRKAQVSGSAMMRDGYKIGEYFSYSYFSTSKASYAIINDIPENFSRPLNDKPHDITTVTDANAILYKMSNGSIERSYLFGAPKDKFNTQFAMNGSAIYVKATNTYITLMVNHKNGDKKAHIAWVKLD